MYYLFVDKINLQIDKWFSISLINNELTGFAKSSNITIKLIYYDQTICEEMKNTFLFDIELSNNHKITTIRFGESFHGGIISKLNFQGGGTIPDLALWDGGIYKYTYNIYVCIFKYILVSFEGYIPYFSSCPIHNSAFLFRGISNRRLLNRIHGISTASDLLESILHLPNLCSTYSILDNYIIHTYVCIIAGTLNEVEEGLTGFTGNNYLSVNENARGELVDSHMIKHKFWIYINTFPQTELNILINFNVIIYCLMHIYIYIYMN